MTTNTGLWATATKEWVIPAKAKPGRKPKKDLTAVNDEDDPDKRSHNRAAQRAFRERKQTQLQELQTKLQQYEQGEIERNVALQNIARRLKEDNVKLAKENEELKAALEVANRKRAREEEVDLCPTQPKRQSFAKSRTNSHNRAQSLSSSSSSSSPPTTSYLNEAMQYSKSTPKAPSKHTNHVNTYGQSLNISGCGFCNEDTPCVCNEEMADIMFTEDTKNLYVMDDDQSSSSILDNLPAYAPPLPLRRRPQTRLEKPIFSITKTPTSSVRDQQGQCTGDPKNCLACADDSFGQAFCEAIGESSQSQGPCACCPSKSHKDDGGDDVVMSEPTIPTNDAWRRIKSHPNVSFADLNLLAEVIARRGQCDNVEDNNVSSPSAQVNQKPQLVPQDELIQNGKKHRLRHVHESSVKEALSLLDANFAKS